MVVGEVKPDATVTIIGVGEVPSEGVVRGEIEDTSKVIQCVYDAWNMAQDHADVDIMTVYLSVTAPTSWDRTTAAPSACLRMRASSPRSTWTR